MGNPFQDQLLKAGLVNKKQVKKARQANTAKRKKNKGKKISPEINKARQEQLAREKENRERNRQLNIEKQKQETLSQIRQLVDTNRLKLKDDYDDAPYYFAVGKKIKKLYVNKETAKKLESGQLAIVGLDEQFSIIPGKVAKQILSRDPEITVVLHKPED